MKGADYYTYQEITNQATAWSQALELVRYHGERIRRVWQEFSGGEVIFTGCGSTYYLSLAAATLFQELTGESARAVPASELLLNPRQVLSSQRTLLVANSRSGTTSETVKAVEMFKASQHGSVIVMTNYISPLSQLGDISIVISKGQEESVAQTRSFASLFVAANALSALIAGREDLLNAMSGLPILGDSLLNKYDHLAKQIGTDLHYDRFYFLGSGIHFGLACEANLKMKEMTLTHSEPFHFLEFRHGPMSMVNEATVVVGLLSGKNARYERAVMSEMQAKGGTILTLAESGADISFESGIDESVRGVLYLPILQLMAFHRSLAKGLNPDRPKNLEAVVKLDL